MSIPDIDAVLESAVGQHEYAVPMATAKPEDMSAVALAYRAGVKTGQQQVYNVLKSLATSGQVSIALFALEKKIEEIGKEN